MRKLQWRGEILASNGDYNLLMKKLGFWLSIVGSLGGRRCQKMEMGLYLEME